MCHTNFKNSTLFKEFIIIIIIIIIYSFIKMQYIKWQCTIGERDMQGSVRALKAAPKLHNYNST